MSDRPEAEFQDRLRGVNRLFRKRLAMDNQHYTPKAHLDKFIHPSSAENVLYPYAKGGHSCRPRGTKKLASYESFYVQTVGDGLTDNSLDESLQNAERLMFASGKRTTGPLAKCIYEGRLPATVNERLDLVAGIALMRCRAPVQIHNTAMQGDLSNQMWFLNTLNTDQARAAYIKSGIPAAEVDAEIEVDRRKLLSGELWLGIEDQRQAGLESFQFTEMLAAALSQMRMRLIHVYRKDVFITSDNPVVVNVPGFHRGEGISQTKDTEVWFPISYNRGILLDHREGPDGIEYFGHSQSISLNRRILKWCHRFVYSPLRLNWLKVASRQERFNPLLGRMRSLGDLVESAEGDIVSTQKYLENADACDVFHGMDLT